MSDRLAARPADGFANKENIMAEPEKEDRVRDRAYALWEKDGRPDGRSDEYWQQARSEVEAEEAEPGNESPEGAKEKRQPPSAGSKTAR
jgi:Protein of unknown function (DUF2934)